MRSKKSQVLSSAILTLVSTLIACSDGDDPTGISEATPEAAASVQINPPTADLLVGSQLALSATLQNRYGQPVTGRVEWSTSDTSVAVVSGTGDVTARREGTAIIRARSGSRSGQTIVTVKPYRPAGVTMSPAAVRFTPGQSLQFSVAVLNAAGDTLRDRAVVWASSDSTIARVSPAGLVTALAEGRATITTSSGGTSGVSAVTVSAASAPPVPVAGVTLSLSAANLAIGETTQLTTMATDSSGTVLAGRTASWSSSAPEIVSISPAGLLTGLSEGVTTVTATSGSASASLSVTVSSTRTQVATVTVSPATATVHLGYTTQLAATLRDANGNVLTGRTITWRTSDTTVATVTSTGLVYARATGTATISASSPNGRRGTATITVIPVPVASVAITAPTTSIMVGTTVQLSATPKDANGNALSGRSVTWESSNTASATVSATGLVTGVAADTVIITATSEGKSGMVTIAVTPVPVATVAVTPATATVNYGSTVQLTATLYDASGNLLTGRTITWVSSDTSIITVSASGLATGAAPGSATVTATSEGKSQSAAITVKNDGTVIFPGEDIQARVNAAPAGTAFLLKAGVHRLQSVTPKNGMSFTGEPGAIMSGARLLTTFAQQGGYWVATGQTQEGQRMDERLPNGGSMCLSHHPRCTYPEDLFLDETRLRHVASLAEVGPGTWYFDYAADKIYFADNPAGRKVETSVTPTAFKGSADNVTIRNLIIERYATPLQRGTVQAWGGSGWVIEGNEVRWNHGGGIITGTRTVARRNNAHHNVQYGMAGTGEGAIVEDNEIAYNNYPQTLAYGWASGGTKWYNTRNLVLRRNFVHHNKGAGLWTDIDNIYTLIEYNRVEDNARNGIFHEIGYDAVIRFNTCERNGFEMPATMRGGGIAVTSSPNVEIYGNTLINNNEGFAINQDERGSGKYGLYEVRNLHVHDNVVTMSSGYSGLGVNVADSQAYYTSKNNRFENNTYNLGSNSKYFMWQSRARTEAEWKAYGQDVTGTFNR